MKRFPRISRWLLAVWCAVLAVGSALPVSAQNGNAYGRECQKGAYVSMWVKDDGSPFTSTGDCVSYLRGGGELVPVFLDIDWAGPIPDSSLALATVTGSGLTPLQPWQVSGLLADGTTATGFGSSSDATGRIVLTGSYPCGAWTLLFTIGTYTQTDLLDAYGNPIRATIEPEC